MHNLYLLNYNNYYNRLFKKLNTLNDYLLADPEYLSINSFNFFSEDDINATATINTQELDFDINRYNYLLSQRENTNSFDRWFITKIENIRGCQYKVVLRKDLISENWDNIKSSTLFVEKGYCNISNPQFFNQEPISVTEMPVNQTYLKDDSGVSWLVAYLPKISSDIGTETITTKDSSGNTVTTTTHWYDKMVNFQTSNLKADYTATRDEVKSALYNGRKIIGSNGVVKGWYRLKTTNGFWLINYDVNSKSNTKEKIDYISQYEQTQYITADNNSFKGSWSLFLSNLADSLNYKTYEQFNSAYKRYNNTIIQEIETDEQTGETTTRYFRVSVTLEDRDIENTMLNVNTSKLGTYIQTCYDNGSYHSANINGIYCTIKAQVPIVTFTETQLSSGNFIYQTSRVNTNGGAYDCIVVPYKDENGNGATINGVYHDPETMMCFMSQLSASWGTEVVYDVQCLPYQPTINLYGILNKDYDIIWKDGVETPLGYVYYVSDINRTFNIDVGIEASNNKVDYLTKHYKLVGPNYNSSFDLRVYENNGIDYFNVDMTLLPYSPWIKINPNFKYLNGKDFNDATGLVLSGNFSISQLTNSFTEYQYNNSNYEAIFNAQMGYTEYSQKLNRIGSTISGVTSAITTGVGVGAIASNPALGVAAGIASAGAGIADYAVQKKIDKKQNEYTREQYELQLGNIKSKPTTLAKVTALNINTKMFPYIEEYACTEIEYAQVSKYLEYNGMSINSVGFIEDYLKPNYYFEAGVIRFKDITCNNYILGEIRNELKQGFYIESEIN